MKRKPAWRRYVLFLVGTGAGAAMFTYGHSYLVCDTDGALRILATVCAILVGFLLAVITMAGDPRNLPSGNWRAAAIYREEIARGLRRHKLLFYAYLSTICLALLAVLFEPWEVLDRAALSFGVSVVFWSFGLPGWLEKVQMERLASETERRFEEAKNPSP